MPLTNAGRDFIAQATVTPATVPFNSANAFLAVGNGTTAFTAAQADLVGGSTARVGMDSSYPSGSANVLTFRSTYGTSVANFDWNEWAVTNASASGTMLCRKVEILGTKASTQSWQFTVDITVNNP